MAMSVTLTEQIDRANRSELGYRDLHPSAIMYNEETGTTIEVPFSSYTEKYRDYLSAILVRRYMSERDCAKYRFRPKMLSVDLYGSAEFWNDILVLNNCGSVKEFQPIKDKPTLFYDPKRLKTYLNEILILEGQLQ